MWFCANDLVAVAVGRLKQSHFFVFHVLLITSLLHHVISKTEVKIFCPILCITFTLLWRIEVFPPIYYSKSRLKTLVFWIECWSISYHIININTFKVNKLNAFHAAGESRIFNKFVKNVKIVEFRDHIWNQHKKCIQISTNMPGIGLLIREIAVEISEMWD